MKRESILAFFSTSGQQEASAHTEDLCLLSWSGNLSLAKFVVSGITNRHAGLCHTMHLPSDSRK